MKKLLYLQLILACFPAVYFAQVSAIRQLEEMTGTTIDRGYYNGGYDSYGNTPAPAADQQYYNEQYGSVLGEQAHDEYERGAAAWRERNWEAAQRHFCKAAKLNPKNAAYQTNCTAAQQLVADEKARIAHHEYISKTFLTKFDENKKTYRGQVTAIRKDIRGVPPPLPGTPTPPRRVVEEGIMLGLFNTQKSNSVPAVRSPKTGAGFKEGSYYATSDNRTILELVRGVIDNQFMGAYTLNSPWGKQLVESLRGTHFGRLYAHSNGATVSEALIREGVITVDELNILGGDRSYMNFEGYNELIASGKVKRIVVWYNPGDMIPYGSSFQLVKPGATEQDEYSRIFNAFYTYSLEHPEQKAIEFRKLEGPEYSRGQSFMSGLDFFDAHGLDAYFENIKRYYQLHGGQ